MADYSTTVNLPKTDFPMKAELPKREPELLAFWREIGVYEKMLEANKDKKPFVLHDGPPYANGHIHIGHALNKTLKDMAVKARALAGHRTPYVPGWDCHGLPIEQALLKEMGIGKSQVTDLVDFRRKAADFARRWIGIQRDEFKRLGVFGEWEKPYTTMDHEYESAVLRAFRVLLNAGYIYRGLKPVYWCVHCETALAEAEIEYRDRVSPSIYVAFPYKTGPMKKSPGEDCSVLIWTTTPWTLPANVALAFHPSMEYVRVRVGPKPRPGLSVLEEVEAAAPKKKGAEGSALAVKVQPKKVKAPPQGFKTYIVAKDRLAAVMDEINVRDFEILDTMRGTEFEGMKADHPFAGRESVGVLAGYVTAEDGTGIVHTAPGHGQDDYETGKKYGLPVLSPVDASGRFTKEAGPSLVGLKTEEGGDKVIATLKEKGHLLAYGELRHSYPHCWRCKNAILFRATEQWFLSVDHQGLRQKLLASTEQVKWIPPVGQSRISGMLKVRPDWVLSRQRFWGTPIPVVYCETCHKPFTNNEALLAVETRVANEGTDFWFAEEPSKFLPKDSECDACGGKKFRKETDILDVWVDSGCSWLGVLKGREIGYPAQMYLEGSDQHRGWFQSSLVPSVAMEGRPPYESVLTHGFVLDETGRAMHKSLGNVVSPQTVVEKFGADVLRLWVALSDVEVDVRLSQKLLDGPIDMYRKLRNTIRYLLGNTFDFDPTRNKIPYSLMLEQDRFILHCLSYLVHEVREDYKHFRFRQATRKISDFCINDLSSFYLDSLKDRLYVLKPGDPARRSAQTVLHEILVSLTQLLAPVLTFTSEEAWQHIRKRVPTLEESVFLTSFPEPHEDWFQTQLELKWRRLLAIRDLVNLEIEAAKKSGLIKSSGEAKVTLMAANPETEKFLEESRALWHEVLLVADVAVQNGGTPAPHSSEPLSVKVEKTAGEKCQRCWQRRTDLGQDPSRPELCSRCIAALA